MLSSGRCHDATTFGKSNWTGKLDRRERPHCPWGKKYFLLRIWSECCESTLHSRGKYVGCAPRLLPAHRPMWLLSELVLLSLLTVVSILILFFSVWEIIKIYKANNIEKQINVDVWPTEDLWKTIGLACWKDSSLWSERSTLDCAGGFEDECLLLSVLLLLLSFPSSAPTSLF